MQCSGFDYQAKSEAIPKLASILKKFLFEDYFGDICTIPNCLPFFFLNIYVCIYLIILSLLAFFIGVFCGPNKKLLIYLVNNFHPIKIVIIMNAFN